jgi:3-deoxy-manno-octulosonate cytidylyltransferase (CMP-KDO synthetase)
MNKLPQCYGIIPARYQSARFPGKPLADIHGKPMYWHVYQRARQCPEFSRIVLATDDRRIENSAHDLDVPVVMTAGDHPSGTDRVLEAAKIIKVPQDGVVVNIQGDEPALEPAMLTELLTPFRASGVSVTTLARKISVQEAQNPDRVKVVFAPNGKALYFSRCPIPHPHSEQKPSHYVHIGIYAFRMNCLREFVSLDQSPLEITEKLEQLRLLENNIPIQVVLTEYQSIGVDRPEDIAIVSEMMLDKL